VPFRNTCFVFQFQVLDCVSRVLVAGRVIDSSLKSSSLFSILAGEREDSSLSSKARAYLGLVFHLNRDFPQILAVKKQKKNPKTPI
jgi:hypothetical protein